MTTSKTKAQSLLRTLRDGAAHFRRAENGAVAIQFAVLVLPLTILTFGLLDINRASVAHRRLQDSLDAATLLAARSSGTTDAQLSAVGKPSLQANLAAVNDTTLTASGFKISGTNVVGSATAKVKPVVANLWMQGDMQVHASSTVARALNKVEVVMVLDNTGSMASSSKLTNLKTAATTLVDTLSATAAKAIEPHSVKIGMVPFSTTVRLSSTNSVLNTYKSGSWMANNSSTAYSNQIFTSNTNRFTAFSNMGVNWAGCVESRPAPYDVQDTAPTSSTPDTLFVPYFWPDEPDPRAWNKNGSFDGNDNYNFSNNYVPDEVYSSSNWKVPQGNGGKYDESPDGSGPNKNCTMSPMVRLTEDWSGLKTAINNMVAVGETHIPIGLVWGWHLLSPNAPFADGVAYNTPKVTKVAVLMTDGDNTWGYQPTPNGSDYDGYGYIWQNRLGTTSNNEGTRTTAMDNRLKLLCDNMKAKKIVIYTVGVMVSTNSKSLLTYCATDSAKFFDVTSSSQMNSVFATIAGDIQNLRIVQ